MEQIINIANVVSWVNGLRLVNLLFGLFLLWRSIKVELHSETIYTGITLIGITSILYLVLGNYPANFIYSYLVIVWSLILAFTIKRSGVDYWPTLDYLAVPLTSVFFIDSAINLLAGFGLSKLVWLLAATVYGLIIYRWTASHYKVLSWYPSGRAGFIFICFLAYIQIICLPIDLFSASGLYWPRFVYGVALVCAIWLYFRRAGLRFNLWVKRALLKLTKK